MGLLLPDQARTFCASNSVRGEVGGLVNCKVQSCKIFKKQKPEGLQVSEDILVAPRLSGIDLCYRTVKDMTKFCLRSVNKQIKNLYQMDIVSDE